MTAGRTSDDHPVGHISDTAHLVAIYRAMETERPDAIFRDPYARRLGGTRGEEVVAALPNGRASAWALIVRTAVLDEIIRERVAGAGVDLVVNFAAGLDTRPWRLELPPTLRWVDVDLPAILQYKTEQLRGETPRCHYETVAVDLTDTARRHALLTQLGASATRALVITEGLLVYLEAAQVTELARAFHAVPSFRWWLCDLANTRLLTMLQKRWNPTLAKGNAPMQFAVDDAATFFGPLGWRLLQFRSALVEAHRLDREMRGAWLTRLLLRIAPAAKREDVRLSGFALLERES